MEWNNWGGRPKDQDQILLANWDRDDGWLFEIATYFQETDSILIDGEEIYTDWDDDHFHSFWRKISNPPLN